MAGTVHTQPVLVCVNECVDALIYFLNGVGAAGAGSGSGRVTAQLRVRLGTGVACYVLCDGDFVMDLAQTSMSTVELKVVIKRYQRICC